MTWEQRRQTTCYMWLKLCIQQQALDCKAQDRCQSEPSLQSYQNTLHLLESHCCHSCLRLRSHLGTRVFVTLLTPMLMHMPHNSTRNIDHTVAVADATASVSQLLCLAYQMAVTLLCQVSGASCTASLRFTHDKGSVDLTGVASKRPELDGIQPNCCCRHAAKKGFDHLLSYFFAKLAA